MNGSAPDFGVMNETAKTIHPYELDIGHAPKSDVLYQWAIRKSGKIFQRSDRTFPSEAEARRKGTETIERLLSGFDR